jgi:hypothetical protein
VAGETHFDDALPRFAALVRDVLGEEAPLDHFLRDSGGRLTFVYTFDINGSKKGTLIEGAKKIRPYVDEGDMVISSPSELLDPALLDPDVGVFEYIEHPEYEGFVRVVERRIVGQDWLTSPREPLEGVPPIIVFGSHKGGVGRSTALAVSANALAQNDYNVLVLDLDLEAPGLGGTLLPNENISKFGTLDYFVESIFSEVSDDFLDQMTAVIC